MGRCGVFLVAIISSLILGLAGCGSTHSSASGPVPSTITLSPSSASLEMGQTQQLTVTSQDFNKQTITVPVTYISSNTAVLTVSNGGLVCAGSWDSLAVPVTCTPGPAGVALVTASSGGVVSPPATFYVHSHIDNISIAPIMPLPVPNCTASNSNTVGLSQNQIVNYQASAFSQGNDITATVGPFSWSTTNGIVVKLNSSATGLLTNQVQATASAPGLTQVFASAGGVTSSSVDFETCRVQSITLGVAGGSGNTINFASTGSQTITATVTDSAGTTLATLPTLTWSSSQPLVASAAANGNIGGTVTGHIAGGATIIGSCTPPTCNGGFVPSLPIYPNTAISVTVAASGAAPTTSAYAATTKCGTNFGCTSSIVAIAVPANTIGNSATLPNTPNSFVFDRQGKTGYLGSDHGLMVFAPANLGSSTNPITVHSNVTGKVLAVSPDGNKVIVSDTSSNPNQVFVFDTTSTGGVVNLLISGARAAAFSPDNLKAYIAAGSNLYAYSALEPLVTVPLTTQATDVTFLPVGAFAYVAGGTNPGGAFTDVTTCTNTPGTPVAITGAPVSIRALVDGSHLLALDPPGIDVITTNPLAPPPPPPPAPPPVPTFTGCPPPGVSTTVAGPVNLGQGQFTPLKFLVASDGSKAYVIASNFGAVMVYDVAAGTSSAIPLSGNATTLDGDLTLDGNLLYVAGSDGAVHAINTVSAADQTISFPANFNFCNNVSFTCPPDLLAVQP